MELMLYQQTQPAIITQDITGELVTSFISFIDRSAKTARTYITNLRQFFAWLQYKQIRRPERQDVINYREWLTAPHEAIELTPEGLQIRAGVIKTCKPTTIKQYLQSVRQFFAWTAAEGYYPNIAANIHGPKVTQDHRKDSLEPADVLAIEESITANTSSKLIYAESCQKDTAGRIQRTDEQAKRIKAMYLLAVTAGLRTIELSRAKVKDLETRGGRAWLWVYGKGHTEADTKKAIPLEVAKAIQEYLEARTDKPTLDSPLFTATGNRSAGKPIATTTISTMLKKAMQEAGYNSSRITAHSLRHTAAQNVLAITGDNIYKTQKYMRHSNPATTEIYLNNAANNEEADIAEQLYTLYHEGK